MKAAAERRLRRGIMVDAMMTIRRATTSDISRIHAIEKAAAELFRDIGLDAVADDPLPSRDELTQAIEGGHAFVFVDPRNTVVAYMLLESVDDECHLAQVSVLPSHGRRGIGRALIEEAAAVARASGQESLTLTTFRDVPWNAPYYKRIGFTIIDDDEIGPQLREVCERENRFAAPRVCMRKRIADN